jgi:type I restriction enzyme S subunit
VPSILEQQQRVAEIEKQFSRLDEAVANLKRVKANLKRYKAAVLDAAVKGRLGTADAASEGEMPAGWQWSSVGELATVGTGATPARSNEAFYRGGTIPWVTSSAVNEPFVHAADQFVTDEALRQTNLTLYPPGTLLVAMYGEGKTRGKCSELRIAATTNQALAALQADPAVRPWLKLFLEHNYDNTRRIASGGVQPNLNLGLIRAIRLPLPPLSEQQRIVAEVDRRLSIVREVEAEIDANLKRAQALRQAVLARAFAPPGER